MKNYVKPMMESEVFAANEYIAACGDSGVVYNFECNAGDRNHEYAVYTYNNWGIKKYLKIGSGWDRHEIDGHDYYYHPCYTTHEAESDSGFLTGYYMDDMSTWKDDKIPVTVWTDYGTDVHCTTKLDQSSWETAKS